MENHTYQYCDLLTDSDIRAIEIAADLRDCTEEQWVAAYQHIIDNELEQHLAQRSGETLDQIRLVINQLVVETGQCKPRSFVVHNGKIHLKH